MRFKIFNPWYLLYIAFIILLYTLIIIKILPEIFIHVPLILAFIPTCYKAIQNLKERRVGTELFITIAAIISFIGHQEQAMGIVLIIMLIANYLEELISKRTEKEIRSLINLIPQNAIIKIDGIEKTIEINAIKPDMLVLVKTGARIPVDGTIVEGVAAINEAALTGESIPKEKGISDFAYAGTFIESGSIVVKTEKIGQDTFFGKIVDLVQTAKDKKAKISILTDKIAFFLVPSMLILIAITWFITKNLNLITTLLVFGSPLELTLITPIAILSGIIAAFRNGVLVKGGLALERFSKVDTIIFDKTGTLTIGQPEVINIESYDQNFTKKDILTIAAIAEKRSGYALSKAILKKAAEENLNIPDPESYKSIIGHGIEIVYNNQKWFLGNKHFLQSPEHGNINITNLQASEEDKKYSSFYIGNAGKLYGKIYTTDKIRHDAKQTIEDLKQAGLRDMILLSGDTRLIANEVGTQLGFTKAYGDVFPDQKLLVIDKLQKEGHSVSMVGDGINDAPALKQANVGIAMGIIGMEPAI